MPSALTDDVESLRSDLLKTVQLKTMPACSLLNGVNLRVLICVFLQFFCGSLTRAVCPATAERTIFGDLNLLLSTCALG